MATVQDPERQRTYKALQDSRPTKVRKTDLDPPLPTVHNNPLLSPHRTWRYPPEFWDRLSTVPLERDALEELDRRTCGRPPPSPPTGFASDHIRTSSTSTRDLARFSRHGGPDLQRLRGYPAPAIVLRDSRSATAMSSTSQSRVTKSTDPRTATKSGLTRTRKSISAYNRAFEQHLTDHGVYTTWNSQEPELDAIYAILAKRRTSLSPSRFSDNTFKAFRRTNAKAKDEKDVCKYILPAISGSWEDNYPSTEDMAFGNLEPLTDGTIAPPKPDIALGALPDQLNPIIRKELQHHIIPSTATDRVIAPNFFVEAKGPDGSTAVMLRQARYDGAIGARAMHSLQNYGVEELVYNGQPYTYSATYHNGTLQLYAHHITAPSTPHSRPEYHMTELAAYALNNKRETFVEGVTAFRNARDMAKQHRDTFIEAANSKHYTRLVSAYENLEHPSLPDSDDRQPSAAPCQLQQPDDQRDSSQDPQSSTAAIVYPPPSLTARLTVSLKRSRNSQSPPSDSHRPKKHRAQRTE
ncbi:hypothetical protein VM1G_08894 [Cytospora mali]|uniref:DUF7924 domain-containing protein n=1 Tax=Cytospora mali TaxID=578113 RepID=A0A194WBB3_CYTMA|nr:hypothetical protein VM1G_08894 [Valsa mali]